jgi:TonB-dependent starch-binding outer membrane protein SusC
MKKKVLLLWSEYYCSHFKKNLLIMKLTMVFLLLGIFSANAFVFSQDLKIDFSQKSYTVGEALATIEKNTTYRFLYRNDQIDLNRFVKIDASEKTIDAVLTSILKNTGINYKTVQNNLIILSPIVEQQKPTVSGKITDNTGLPLVGVTVSVTGTNRAVISDVKGNYSITLNPPDKSLTYSFIGMKKQDILISGRILINVVLENETSTLEEVVVVGYGSQKKVNLTGAVSAVKIDDKLASRSITNVSSGMSGLIPGLAVAQSSGMAGNDQASMIIRGLGTINSASPLVVVDGMPDVDINRINMNDVESISVLKDAASSAVYGSRAANGVILITTKSGKGQGKTKINFSSSSATEVATNSFDFNSNYPRTLTLEQRAQQVGTLPSLLTYKNGTIDQWLALGMINPLQYPNTDWWKIITRNGSVKNYNLSASGSNDKSNFYISAGVMNQQGLQINNDYSRYNTRFTYDYKVRNNMNIGVKFAGTWTKYTFAEAQGFTDPDPSNTGGYSMEYAIPGITPYDPISGNFGGVMAYGEDPQAHNPYVEYIGRLTHQNRQEANTSIYGDWSPIKGLTARFDYALNYYNQFQWSGPTPSTAYNFQTNSFGSRIYVGANAGISNATNTGYKTQMNGSLNYHTQFGKNHDLNMMFAYSEEYWYDRYESASRNDRLYPALDEIDAALPTIQSTAGNSGTEGLQSYIGRVNYSAFNKYLFEANCRYDGSSKFLPGYQFGLFPSAALGWRFTEENFLKRYTESWLSSGKFRVSYGSLGNNSGVGRYEQQPTLGASAYMVNGIIVNGFVSQKMTNVDLTWETTTVMNFGMDLGFLKNRLVTEIDYYDRLTTGMNQPSSMSNLLTGAYNAPRINIGNLRNRGIEINLTWKDIAGEFSYAFNVNASYNKTNLEKWSGYLGRGTTFINMPYHFVYGYKDSGIAKTWADVYKATPQGAQPGDLLLVDVNGDGKIDGNDQVAYPDAQSDRPTTNFGMNGNVSFKGFDLSFLLQGAAGRKSYWLNQYNTVNIPLTRYASSWQQWNNPWSVSNPNGIWPRLQGNGNNVTNTSFWLQDMSYLRLKNIQIGYTLPKNWLRKLGVDNVRIYATGENLLTFTKWQGLDPERLGNANDMYPLNKSFSIGINVGL